MSVKCLFYDLTKVWLLHTLAFELMEWNVSKDACILQQICLQNISLWVFLCAHFSVKDLDDKAA